MSSNVYLAFGMLAEQPVMKIGKANNIAQREKQIKISIELSCPCDDETQAFALESKLRRLMRSLGGKKIATRHDWHVFNAEIYDRVKQMLVDSFGVEVLKLYDGKGQLEDFEILLLQSRYQLSLRLEKLGLSIDYTNIDNMSDQQKIRRLKQQISELESELLQERSSSTAKIDDLTRQVVRAEVELEMYRTGRLKPSEG